MVVLHRKFIAGGFVIVLLLAACAARPTALLRPNGVGVAPDGSLYVMDRGNYRVVHLSPDGRLLGAFGKLGRQAHEIYAGWDLALDAAGNIYICNHVRDETDIVTHDGVKVFAPNGRLLREVGGADYTYEETSRRPYGVEVDNQGRLYVADYGANAMRVFDAEGSLLGVFFGQRGSGDDDFFGLNDVAVDDQRNLLYITDQINSRIKQFGFAVTESGDLTLTHRLTFGSYGQGPGQFAYPQNLAVDDSSGRVYVGDMANRRVQAFDVDGHSVAEFYPPGVQVWQVMGLAVGPDGAVYVADAFNNAIWSFEPDGRLRSRIEVKQ